MELEETINYNLTLVSNWLKANKLSLNIDKTNFIIFHPPQIAIKHTVMLSINNKVIKQEKHIKYLGLFIDSHLCWKYHILHISKKIKRWIGILSKIWFFVSQQVLVQLYYSLIYPFLTYSLTAWGNTYKTSLQPLFILQKKAVRIITFSDYKAHSSALFYRLEILKLFDLIYSDNFLFVYDYYTNNFQQPFMTSLKAYMRYISITPDWQARNLTIFLKTRTNYGKFNIRFIGTKMWNSIQDDLKSKSRTCFKKQLKFSLISSYRSYW